MNCLIVFPEELVSDLEASLHGERLRHAIEAHGLTDGLRVRAAILGGRRGFATVVNVSASEMRLRLELPEGPLARKNQLWIVSLARPQTVKKVIHAAATLGIKELHFVRSAQTVKSYTHSPVLHPESLFSETLKGLEQSGDSVQPRITVHPLFRPFVEDVLPAVLESSSHAGEPLSFIAHTRSDSLPAQGPSREQNCVIAIGPEAGWNEHEVEQFNFRGFIPISLGERFFRVDTAAIYLSAQIEALRSKN